VEVILWAGDVGNGVREMLKKRFPNLRIILKSDQNELETAFNVCDLLLHGSGPFLVAANDIEYWVNKTGKPYGIYGITLSEESTTEKIITLLNQSRFTFFRDSVSLRFAKDLGIKAPVMEFGPDGAFGVDLRNDKAANQFMVRNKLKKGKFLCVIPKYRKTPYWEVPGRNNPYNEEIDKQNHLMIEHDMKPYREAIESVVNQTDMKVLICPEDVTQIALGKKMLYDPLPERVKSRVVWRDHFWLTDEAVSTYIMSAGLFGLEQHSPIMCIGNGIPALVGRFKEQTSKGFMWQDIGLGEWLFDSDSEVDMGRLVSTVLSLAKEPEASKMKAIKAKEFVEERQMATMQILRNSLYC
jgi:hypothetical protein